MPNTLDWKIYMKCLQIIYIGWLKLHKNKIESDSLLMRYRKSPLDVRREYVKIQKSVLRPILMTES